MKCRSCEKPVDRLEVFPGGVCLTCWADSPEGRRVPTVEEFVGSWGARVLR